MATSTSQRVTIWIIAVVMALGSIGFYFLIILQNESDKQQASQQQTQQQQAIEAQKKQQEETLKSKQPLPGYETAPFDAKAVTTLTKEDLVAGTGEEVPKGAKVKVNYMGWLPEGKLFDSSNTNGTVTPIELSLDGVIDGWKEGVPGMKVGSKRKLVIPAAQAYGEQGSPPIIPGNTPLTFILEVTSIEK